MRLVTFDKDISLSDWAIVEILCKISRETFDILLSY